MRTLYFLLLSALSAGCSALSVLEFQDAESIGEGKGSTLVGVSIGPDFASYYYDTTRTLNGLLFPMLEGRAIVAVSDRVDASLGFWTSTITPLGLLASTVDLGLRGGMKWTMTERGSRHAAALGFSIWGYGAGNTLVDDDPDRRGALWSFGGAPTVIYSYRLAESSDAPSLYLGVKGSYLYNNAMYGSPFYDSVARRFDSSRVRDEIYESVGAIGFIGLKSSAIRLEAALMAIENRRRDGFELAPYVGIVVTGR